MRKLPKHGQHFLDIAKQGKLSCPLGRALYACNRVANGQWNFAVLVHPNQYGLTSEELQELQGLPAALESLRRIRPSTAQRWLAHWNNGGNIKSLAHGVYGRRSRNPKFAHLYYKGYIRNSGGGVVHKDGDVIVPHKSPVLTPVRSSVSGCVSTTEYQVE